MLLLNDDCLSLIFELTDLRTQLVLANTCWRFRQIVVDFVWSHEHREVSTMGNNLKSLSKDEYEQFFELNAVNMEKLRIDRLQNIAFSSYLGRYNWRPELMFHLRFDMPKLRELECLDMSFNDGHMRLVAQKCPGLHVLYVTSRFLTGEYVVALGQLRMLEIPHGYFSVERLEQFLSQLPHLIKLNISGNSGNMICDEFNSSQIKILTISLYQLQARDIKRIIRNTPLQKIQFHLAKTENPPMDLHSLNDYLLEFQPQICSIRSSKLEAKLGDLSLLQEAFNGLNATLQHLTLEMELNYAEFIKKSSQLQELYYVHTFNTRICINEIVHNLLHNSNLQKITFRNISKSFVNFLKKIEAFICELVWMLTTMSAYDRRRESLVIAIELSNDIERDREEKKLATAMFKRVEEKDAFLDFVQIHGNILTFQVNYQSKLDELREHHLEIGFTKTTDCTNN